MKKHILIVDDEQIILDILTRRLERLGFQVLTATAGSQGIEIVKNIGLDLVICDIKLPNGMSGMEVLCALKQHQPLTPFVATSGLHSTSSAVQEIIQNGAALFLKKPFSSLNEVADQISRLLNVSTPSNRQPTTAVA